MFKQETINRSLYLAGGIVVLVLTGVFGSFSGLQVITGMLNLSTVMLVLMIAGPAFYIASRNVDDGFAAMLLNGVLSGLIVSVVLALLVTLLFNAEGAFRPTVFFIFPNLTDAMYQILTFGRSFMPGFMYLLGFAAILSVIAVLLFMIPPRLRRILLAALSLAVVLGLMQRQLIGIITLLDTILLLVMFIVAYVAAIVLSRQAFVARVSISAIVGAIVGVIASVLLNNGTITPNANAIIATQNNLLVSLALIGAVVGLLGAMAAMSVRAINSGVNYVLVSILIAGVMNWQAGMTLTAFIITFVLLALAAWFSESLASNAGERFNTLAPREQFISRQTVLVIGLVVAFIAPTFLGSAITFALALVGLYIIMGVGLNIVVGYAGLLDLGHVGFFAIGAYMTGLLTSPTILTCGVPASEILLRDGVYMMSVDGQMVEVACNIWNFWLAMPVAVFVAGAAGVILGIPVLRLRGDYLAIVTLGLSEIISIIIGASTFKDIFGSAQGISPIPSPQIGLGGWSFEFFSANIYYLVVPGILISAFISNRLVNSRVGRAWRSMRADEDVAEAMGIDLVKSKLSAFGISAAFAGLGGTLFAAGLQGAFPNSFTLLVSVNVLSMIIIGGLGSIPGVLVGALMLVGLPEFLRELQDYRLLVFGMLLVGTMLLKPEGLIPPPVRRIAGDGDTDEAEMATTQPPLATQPSGD